MTIYIKHINPLNINEVKQLKVNSKQTNFIANINECLNEAQHSSQWYPVAIYNNKKVIGFAMYGCFGKNKETWIDRFFIDEQFQSQGFGRKSMKLLISYILDKYETNTIYLSIVRGNKIARNLYEGLGFYYTNIDDLNAELVFQYKKLYYTEI